MSYSTGINVPLCFAIEREQTVSSSIMNIVRDANIVASGYGKVINAINQFFPNSESKDANGKTENSDSKAESKTTNGILGDFGEQKITKLANSLMPGSMQILSQSKVDGAYPYKSILSPYNFLYATKMTGFKFAFPMLTRR